MSFLSIIYSVYRFVFYAEHLIHGLGYRVRRMLHTLEQRIFAHALYRVVQVVEHLLQTALAHALVHRRQVQRKVTKSFGRQITLAARFIKCILLRPCNHRRQCRFDIRRPGILRIHHYLVIQHYGLLYLASDAVGLAAVIIAVGRRQYGSLCLRRQLRKHLFYLYTAALEDALIQHVLEVLGRRSGQLAFAVEATGILRVGDISMRIHPLQGLHTVRSYQLRDARFFVFRRQQPLCILSYIGAHLTRRRTSAYALYAATLCIGLHILTQTYSPRIIHIEHIHQHGTLHSLYVLGIHPEVLGMLYKVGLVLGRLLGLAVVHPFQRIGTRIALYGLATRIHTRRSGIRGNTSGNLLGTYITRYVLRTHLAHRIFAVFGLRLGYKVPHIPYALHVARLQCFHIYHGRNTVLGRVLGKFHAHCLTAYRIDSPLTLYHLGPAATITARTRRIRRIGTPIGHAVQPL